MLPPSGSTPNVSSSELCDGNENGQWAEDGRGASTFCSRIVNLPLQYANFSASSPPVMVAYILLLERRGSPGTGPIQLQKGWGRGCRRIATALALAREGRARLEPAQAESFALNAINAMRLRNGLPW